MKKLTLSAALVAALFLGLTSCTKNDDVSTTSKSAGTARVIFGSVDEYEQLFANPEETDSLAGNLAARYGTYNSAARLSSIPEDTLYPEFLLKILNNDRIVQIGNWIIKVDAANEQVLALDKQYETEYNDLVNSNLANEHILVFSTEDEVLQILESESPNDKLRVSKLFCSESGSPAKENDFNEYYIHQGTQYRYFFNIRYLKLGIYFELKTRSELQHKSGENYYNGGGSSYSAEIHCIGKYKIACENNEINVAGSDFINQGDVKNEMNYKAYKGSKKLNKYVLQGSGIFRSTNNSIIFQTPYRGVTDGY